jgi:hypothetical protein
LISFVKVCDEVTNCDDLIIENISIVNASYQTMTRSFQSTKSKSINKISKVKLIKLSEKERKEDEWRLFKSIPFIDHSSGTVICNFGVRFSYKSETTTTTPEDTYSSSMTLTSSSNSNTIQEENDNLIASSIKINFYNSIYFTNFNSNFINNLTAFFKENQCYF